MCCFECGKFDNLHEHHVVPRVLGGRKTIKLCAICHGKIHNLDFSNHGNLIKIGLSKSKKTFGRPKGSSYKLNDILEMHNDICLCLLKKMSIRKTAKHTGKSVSTVQRVKKILDKIV
jgi:hypothetical protein